MDDYNKPEALTGTLLAFEGVSDAETILNGPTGCKFYPSSLSEMLYRRGSTFNPLKFSGEFHFCQPRIPCTHLGGYDYIVGSEGRVDRLLAEVTSLKPGLIGIVNSPGASLIGESLATVESNIPVVKVESPGYSSNMGEGFQHGVISILDSLELKTSKQKNCVNLLGISIWHLNWEDSIADLAHLLSLCGIDVRCSIGAGWSVEDIKNSGQAEANVMLHPEFGSRIGKWYEENCSVETICSTLPLGFDNLETWIQDVCSFFSCDSSPALDEIKKYRKRAYREISSMEERKNLPRGRTFSVSADSSTAYAVTKFLYEYLGMVPVAANADNMLLSYLGSNNLAVSPDVLNTEADVFIGSGDASASMLFRNMVAGCAAVESPGLKAVRLREEPVLGLQGTVRLLDAVLNSLMK